MALGSGIWAKIKGSRRPLPVPASIRDFSRYLFVSLTWVPVILLINNHVVEVTKIRGPSMMPYFNERYNETQWPDVCLTWKMNVQDHLRRGMIITFRYVLGGFSTLESVLYVNQLRHADVLF